MRDAAILFGAALLCGLMEEAQACRLGAQLDIAVRCEPANVRLGLVVRHCTAAPPAGYAVLFTNPSQGVSNLVNPPIISIVTDIGPFAVSRVAFQQWLSVRANSVSGTDQMNYSILANAPVWSRQVGRQYYQLVPYDPKFCQGQNCQLIMNNGWFRPAVRAICVAVDDFKAIQ